MFKVPVSGSVTFSGPLTRTFSPFLDAAFCIVLSCSASIADTPPPFISEQSFLLLQGFVLFFS